MKPSSIEVYLALNNLRAILSGFNNQPLLSEQLSKPICAALIPILHFVISFHDLLNVCESYLPFVVGRC